MSEPTGGDWMYSGGYPAFVAAPDEDSNALRATVCNLDSRLEKYQRPQDEIDANGWLIAAAPDLLEALHELWACAETYDEFNDPGHDWYSLRWQVKDAIAKAEGRGS